MGGGGIWARESKFPLPLLTGGHEGYGFVTLDIILKRVYTSVLCNKHILIAKKKSLKKVASDLFDKSDFYVGTNCAIDKET